MQKIVDELSIDGKFWRIPEWFEGLSDEALHQLKVYHHELITFNGRMNLISPRTEKAADLIHFADSILGCRTIVANTDKKVFFDLGSGNGLPGLVMAALYPDCKVVPVEADARKVEFIKHCVGRMGLRNVKAIHARVEDLDQGMVECGITRAMASISKTLLLARQAAAENCEFYHFKGSSWATEVAEIPSQLLAHWETDEVKEYTLPNNETKMTVVLTRKK